MSTTSPKPNAPHLNVSRNVAFTIVNLFIKILDEGFICHVSFTVEGQPFVIPTGYARVDDQLLIHGSQVSRMLRTLAQGIDVCIAVTLVDGWCSHVLLFIIR